LGFAGIAETPDEDRAIAHSARSLSATAAQASAPAARPRALSNQDSLTGSSK
jgi:hypothetical protein